MSSRVESLAYFRWRPLTSEALETAAVLTEDDVDACREERWYVQSLGRQPPEAST